MVRPALRSFQRPLIERIEANVFFRKQRGYILWSNAERRTQSLTECVIQSGIADGSLTGMSLRQLHSASQMCIGEAESSTNLRYVQGSEKGSETDVTLLRREMDQPNARPITLAQLLRTVLESNHVWPLKSNGLQPRELAEVLRYLKDRSMIEGRWQYLDFLQHIESIHDGIRSSYYKVHQRAKWKITKSASVNHINLKEEEIDRQISCHLDVRRWQSLLKSRDLLELLSKCRQVSLRIPTIRDICDIIETISADPLVPDRKSKYEILLHDITRALPHFKRLESERATRLMDQTKMSDFAINWQGINDAKGRSNQGVKATFSGMLRRCKDHELQKPLGSVKIFEEVWKVMQSQIEHTSSSYSAALEIEIKLATWRSAKLRKRFEAAHDGYDQEHQDALGFVWQPVTDLIIRLHEQKLLDSKLINQVLWGTVRYDPNFLLPFRDHASDEFQRREHFSTGTEPKDTERNEDVLQSPINQNRSESVDPFVQFIWPSLDSVSVVYEIMRNTLLQKERNNTVSQNRSFERRKRLNNLPANLLGDVLLDEQHIPTPWTYNIMLRFFSSRGNMKSVLQIIQDMDNTVIGRKSEYPKISMVTFGKIFEGFAKFGIPSRLVTFDEEAPEKSEWTLDESIGEHDNDGWNLNNFMMFFKRFLQLQPDKAAQRTKKDDLKETKSSPNDAESRTCNSSTILQQATSVIDKQLTENKGPIALAPSSQQLFFVVTALRRISGDEPKWVISQIVRLTAKFGIVSDEEDILFRDANGSLINQEGWTRFRMMKRMHRIMEMLYDLRDAEDDQRKSINWKVKFDQECRIKWMEDRRWAD